MKYESLAMVRIPPFCLLAPTSSETRHVFWHSRAVAISYVQEPDKHHAANAVFYICTDPKYSLERLSPPMRRNVRRGFKELRIGHLTSEELLAYGVTAFRDTRSRLGLSDGTSDDFLRRFAKQAQCRGHVFLGSWKGEKLASFLSIMEIEDWAYIEGCFSMNSLLALRPNDALLFYALSYYLAERHFGGVGYGVSSIQTDGNVMGLHAFKTKVGFQGYPVCRVFMLNPLVRPFANRFSLSAINGMLWLKPGNRCLLKAAGVLSSMLQKRQLSEALKEQVQTGEHQL
jgi:hypothetical protein